MSSQTSLVAEQVRLQQWAAQIQDCKNRPADMKVETWCSEHGITKANYYYRLKRVRKACLEVYNPEPAFVELPQPTEKALPQEDSSLKPTAILRNSRGLALEIYNPVSKDMLQCILEVLSNADDATGLKKIYLAAGYTDLRRGMDGLATIIRFRFQLDPYDKNTLFLFCGKKTDRIKGLLWEGDGFLLLYKRLSNGAFNWPRSVEEALEISPEQYTMLMQGLEILPKHPIRLNDPPKRLM